MWYNVFRPWDPKNRGKNVLRETDIEKQKKTKSSKAHTSAKSKVYSLFRIPLNSLFLQEESPNSATESSPVKVNYDSLPPPQHHRPQ